MYGRCSRGKVRSREMSANQEIFSLSCINTPQRPHKKRTSWALTLMWSSTEEDTHKLFPSDLITLSFCLISQLTPTNQTPHGCKHTQSANSPVLLIISQWRPSESILSALWDLTSHFPSRSKLTHRADEQSAETAGSEHMDVGASD